MTEAISLKELMDFAALNADSVFDLNDPYN